MDRNNQSGNNNGVMLGSPPMYQEYQHNVPGMPPQISAVALQVPTMTYPVIFNPQYVQQPPQQHEVTTGLKHAKHHFRVGIFFILIGIATCVVEPFALALIFPHFVLPAGIFLIISGSTSIAGSRNNRKSLFTVSKLFNILAAINLFGGIIAAIVMLCNLINSFNSLVFTYSPSYYYNPYSNNNNNIIQSNVPQRNYIALYELIYCIIIFVLVIWDSVKKFSENRFDKQGARPQPANLTFIYTAHSTPQVVIR